MIEVIPLHRRGCYNVGIVYDCISGKNIVVKLNVDHTFRYVPPKAKPKRSITVILPTPIVIEF